MKSFESYFIATDSHITLCNWQLIICESVAINQAIRSLTGRPYSSTILISIVSRRSRMGL